MNKNNDLDKFKELINKDVAMMNNLDGTKIAILNTVSKKPRYSQDEDFVDCEVIETEDPTSQRIKEQVETINGSAELSNTFNQLFDDMNKKYGLNIKFDAGSFNQSLLNIIDPKAKAAMELYLSESYGRFRVILYSQFLNAIAQLSSQVLDPAYLLSDSISYPDKLEIMERLFNFVNQLNEIYDQVNIDNADLKLGTMSEDSDSDQFDIDNSDVKAIMKEYVKKHREK